jgi:hypothetical protein
MYSIESGSMFSINQYDPKTYESLGVGIYLIPNITGALDPFRL